MTSVAMVCSDHLCMLKLRAIISGWRNTSTRPCQHARRAVAVGECRGQQPHGVAAVPVADRLDVSLLIRIERRRDGDAFGEIDRAPECTRPDDGF